ncbi:hypothetical protein [Capnocytophaga sp.]|uniref:hypothetical protein n=1 Tax=Capnocytophaga sp. TaxID=44737 RepID=UPI0026DBE219|nr:hypothetical protein [Capnocytophaga sp.]MDO5104888.1 hypothetical protein [Capnocytophaga sp.]
MIVDRYALQHTGVPFYYMYWRITDHSQTKNLNAKRQKIGLPTVEQQEFWKTINSP